MKSDASQPSADAGAQTDDHRSRTFVAAFVALIVGMVAYFALGMPGMDHSPQPQIREHERGSTETGLREP